MASIMKYGDGYAIRMNVPDGSGKRSQKFISGFPDRIAAKAAVSQLEAEVTSGTYKAPCELSVADFAAIWLSDHVSQLTPKTQEHYEHTVSYITKHLGKIMLEDLRANQIERMYRDLRATKRLHENTIQHIHKTLRSMINTAIRWDYIESSPIPKVLAPKKKKPQLDYWEVSDIQRGLTAMANTTILYHVKLSLFTGLRLGEVCGLREEDINFSHGYFTVNRTMQAIGGEVIVKDPKTEKSRRRIPMNADVTALFRSRLQDIRENRMRYRDKYDEAWLGYLSVFETGEIQTDQYVGRKWRKLMKSLNEDPNTGRQYEPFDPLYLKPIRFHDLRHSCASWLLFIGADLKEIQEILGHSSFSVTADLYAHLCDKVIRKTMDKMVL